MSAERKRRILSLSTSASSRGGSKASDIPDTVLAFSSLSAPMRERWDGSEAGESCETVASGCVERTRCLAALDSACAAVAAGSRPTRQVRRSARVAWI